VPLKALPRVLDSTAKFGETTLDGLLDKPLTICGVIGDSQASLFAQRCFEPGSAKVTFGTGSSLLMNIGDEPRLSGNGVLTALAWSHAGVPTYAFEGIIISSAATLAWLRDQLGLIASYDELEPLATSVESSGGVYLVPAFSGLGLPHWAPSARAAIVGLSSHSDRRHILRAGLESIAFQVADALEAMGREAGVSIGTIHADGGATRSPFLMQLTADLTRSRILIPDAPDCSPLGAALAGLLGMGHFRDLSHIAETPLAGRDYSPVLPPAQATSLRAGWHSAVRQVLAG
jgi:glycerol kinase